MFKRTKSPDGAPALSDPDPIGAARPKSPSTPLARVLVALAALAVVAVIAGLVVAAVKFYVGTSEVVAEVAEEITGVLTTPGDTGQEVLAQAKQPAPPISNNEVFAFRNVFVPLVQASSTTTAGVAPAAASSTETATAAPANTLYAQGIVTEGGVSKVILKYGSATYTLAPGESIQGTGWKVISVGSTSVTMQFNGINYTLSIGQGLTK